MSIPQVIDGVTELDSELFNPIINRVNGLQTGEIPIPLAGIAGALGGYEPLQNLEASFKTAANYDIPIDGVTPAGGAINAAIDAINSGTEGGAGTLYLPPGLFIVEERIVVPSRFRLLGMGSSSQGLYGGTVLQAAADLNDDVIGMDVWWHWGEIAYLGIEGNKANNTSGSGINVGQMGEASSIHNVQVLRCAEHGFVIGGESTPTSLMDCSAMQNGGSGYYLDSVTRHVSLYNPSGDGNGDSLITINGAGAGPIAFVNIIGIKCECGLAGTHEPAVVIDNYGGNVNFLGGTIEGYADNSQLVAVHRTGANGGHVWFQGTSIARYATQLQDDISSINTIALGTGTHTLSGLVGKTTLDISTGRHFSGRDAGTAIATAGAAAGSSPTVTAGAGTDVRGTVAVTTGTSATTGMLFRLTFSKPYASAPRIVLSAGNAATAAIMQHVYSSPTSGTQTDVSVGVALADSTAYSFNYVVMG